MSKRMIKIIIALAILCIIVGGILYKISKKKNHESDWLYNSNEKTNYSSSRRNDRISINGPVIACDPLEIEKTYYTKFKFNLFLIVFIIVMVLIFFIHVVVRIKKQNKKIKKL